MILGVTDDDQISTTSASSQIGWQPKQNLGKSAETGEADLETNCRKIVQRLEHEGFVLVKTVGSHHKYKKQDRVVTVPYPHPSHDLPPGTVHNIYVQAGCATHPAPGDKKSR